MALLFAAPTAAIAGNTVPVPGESLTFSALYGTRGYVVHFSESSRRHYRYFKVKVTGHGARVTYRLPVGHLPYDGIDTNLGHRGRFDLRFVPAGKVRRLALGHGCEGREGHWQRGYFVGVMRFHGERGYTDAHAHRVSAIAESWPKFRCHDDLGLARRRRRRAQVIARGGEVGFGAVLAPRATSGPRVAYRAWDHGGGRLSISREVAISAPESTFSFPGGLKLPEEVMVMPPAPFTGKATFARTPESVFTWTGDLAVEFPGTAPIRLAGPSFGAAVCAEDRCVRQEPERKPPE